MRVAKSWFATCVWFLFMWRCCSYEFVEKNECLMVSSPEYLKDTYQCLMCNLGIPQHGGSLNGVVVYPKANQKACNSFIDHELSFKTKTLGGLPVLLLVDSGDCYLMWKAWNAQNAGAAGVLIADDRHKSFTTFYLSEEVDDAYYLENITIPSALISRSLGDSIRKALYKGDFVRVNLEWTEDYHQVKKNGDDECDTDNQIEERANPISGFIIKSTSLWRFLMHNIWNWSTSLWINFEWV